jgi:outer membrane protein assembly factor BamD
MRKLARITILCTAVCLLSEQQLTAEIVYKKGEGWSTQAPGSEEETAANGGAQFKKAEEYENAGDTKKALEAYSSLLRKFPNAISGPKAQLKVGQLSAQLGDYEKAFDAYGKYISKYPQGSDFDESVQAQFNIAVRFLNGERRKVFGIKTFGSQERARQMFSTIISEAPYSKLAPLSQFDIGQAFEKEGKPADAINAYKTVTEKYPGDPLAADAQYQIGYVYFTQRREGNYDPRVSEKAREGFEDFIANYPSSEKIPQAQDNLKMLAGKDTSNTLNIAKFYDKTKDYKAAVIYYNEVIKEQPDSPAAQTAKARIQVLQNQVGEQALKAGPEKVETSARAGARRKLQAQVDTAARPDFNGPPVAVPEETPAPTPQPRASTPDVGPVVPPSEPQLPQ